MQRKNPFDNAPAGYCTVRDERLVMPETMSAERRRAAEDAFERLQNFIVHRPYPCVGAQAAFNQEACRFATYDTLGSEEAAAGLARDLFTFAQELDDPPSAFMTFLAVFSGPPGLSERAFERLLWKQLAQLHVLDRRHHDWAPSVSPDPEDDAFSFSFARRGFYVVGMHPGSSRLARGFPRPMLVFNARSQFDQLRERGTYATMRQVIRERDEALQGSVNPMLQDFGEASEARQYSGRAVEGDWTCPFHDAVARAETSSSDLPPSHP